MKLKKWFRFIIRMGALFASLIALLAPTWTLASETVPTSEFIRKASSIEIETLRSLRLQNQGRLKPFDTLARESLLFLTGREDFWNLNPMKIYLGLLDDKNFDQLNLIEVRDPDLRSTLGLEKSKKYFSLKQLNRTPLHDLALPLIKQTLPLDGSQQTIVETFRQAWLLEQIASGEHLIQALDLSLTNTTKNSGAANPAQIVLQKYLSAPTIENQQALVHAAISVPLHEQFQSSFNKLELEVFYNHLSPFLWATIGYFILAGLFFLHSWKPFLSKSIILFLPLIPLSLHVLGFALRVIITGFAPVTNMYGTLLWVSFGVSLFSFVFFLIYSNLKLTSYLALTSALILLFTHHFPLALSPNMDPLLAVLRSNFWLTLHVLTITLSYSAFTIVMLLGNVALIGEIFIYDNRAFYKKYSPYVYHLIQLGCWLLTVGIILGGVWADYSWGRFWGWDPKETWALVANLGFIAILHAKSAKWLNDFTLLAWSALSYLLVLMAWYGVNFILASGLHSYGFSQGGSLFAAFFVTVQVGIFAAALMVRFDRRRARAGCAANSTSSDEFR